MIENPSQNVWDSEKIKEMEETTELEKENYCSSEKFEFTRKQ